MFAGEGLAESAKNSFSLSCSELSSASTMSWRSAASNVSLLLLLLPGLALLAALCSCNSIMSSAKSAGSAVSLLFGLLLLLLLLDEGDLEGDLGVGKLDFPPVEPPLYDTQQERIYINQNKYASYKAMKTNCYLSSSIKLSWAQRRQGCGPSHRLWRKHSINKSKGQLLNINNLLKNISSIKQNNRSPQLLTLVFL